MPGRVKKSSELKKPSWFLWRNKKEGWFVFDINIFPKFDSTYTNDDFELINPWDFTFKATLQFIGLYLGRSAVDFTFRCLDFNDNFFMHAGEFERIFGNCSFYKGVIRGEWKFEKHGSSIRIYLVREIDSFEEEEENNEKKD